jgi:ABC-type antimicrobial peptide transport system permease subunit
MFRNNLLVAWRNLRRNKSHAFINIVGLALGMAIVLLISLWIMDEASFDHYYPNHRRLAEVLLQQQPKGQEKYTGQSIASAIEPSIRSNYKDLFRRETVVSYPFDALIANGDKQFSRQMIWAYSTLPEMFGFRMLSGSAASLNDPTTLLLAHKTALALFGNTDPVNKTVRLGNKLDFKVGGVFEDQPDNSTFYAAQVLLPETSKMADGLRSDDWDNHNAWMFVELADNVTAEQATTRIRNLPTSHIKEWLEELMVYPLDRMHLHGDFKNGVADGGRIEYVWLFGLIGAFVLLLACINFMNLSTARSEQRAREVGIRKTIGSLRSQLIGQFLGESILMAFAALFVALLLVQLTLPWFNEVSAKDIPTPWSSPTFWLLAIGFTLLTGFLAGSYPAFYLSGFDAVKVLKGSFRVGRGARLPRQVLVVTQFTVSLALIISTLIIYRQIAVAMDRPVGYHREGLLTVDINTDELGGHYDELRNEILATGVVENMAESSFSTTGFQQNNDLAWDGQRPEQKSVFYRDVNVTPDFGKTIGWTILQGRDFSRDHRTDSSAMLINEETLRATGFRQPIGQVVRYFGKPYTIIGVVKNMLTNSPYEKIEPAIFLGDGYLGVITIRLKPGVPVHTALAALEPIFKRRNPGSPFLYKFSDDEYAKKFEAEMRVGKLAAVFAGLAIFISCLGLFGLASFIAEQRTKEIGVRKVLGAGVFSLWGLLSRDFVTLVFLSMFIAMPLAYSFMHQWLQNYKIHTDIPWWLFASSGAGILIITLLTVSFQSIKAALMNPVRSLRSE